MMSIAHELGLTGAFLHNYRSIVFREVFDLSAARQASEAAVEASEGNPFGMYRRFALSDLLQTTLLERDVGRAQSDWPALWADAGNATGWTRWLIVGRLAVSRAEIARQAEPVDIAAEWATKAVEVTERTRRRKYEALARSLLGETLVAMGRGPEGIEELRSAVDLADALTNPTGRWRAHAALADGLRATGDDEGFAAATRTAREIVTSFAASLAPERAARLLAAEPVCAILDVPV